MLEEANLISRVSPKKLVVTKPTARQIGDQLSRAMLLHQITFQELWEAMYAIEPPMAAMAAERPLTDALRQRLLDNIEQTRSASAAGEPVVALDIEFHDIVATICGNRALGLAREPLSRLFFPTFQAVLLHVPSAAQRLYDAHLHIAQAIIAHQSGEARQWMDRHIRDFKRGYQQIAHFDVDAPVPWAQTVQQDSRGDLEKTG